MSSSNEYLRDGSLISVKILPQQSSRFAFQARYHQMSAVLHEKDLHEMYLKGYFMEETTFHNDATKEVLTMDELISRNGREHPFHTCRDPEREVLEETDMVRSRELRQREKAVKKREKRMRRKERQLRCERKYLDRVKRDLEETRELLEIERLVLEDQKREMEEELLGMDQMNSQMFPIFKRGSSKKRKMTVPRHCEGGFTLV